MKPHAAFVGLTTYDLIYLVDHLPSEDEKIVALDAVMNAGGPATNAAVTFCHLGGRSRLVSPVGSGSIASAILDELRLYRVEHHDVAPAADFHPPISSVFLTAGSPSRAVVSLNGSKIPGVAPWKPEEVLEGCMLLLVDGHYMDAALLAARRAVQRKIPVVLDGGSWKEGTDELLHLCDCVIASSRFLPPGCRHKEDVLAHLSAAGVRRVAITDGPAPILFREEGGAGRVDTVPSKGVDTTGAGDVFHGAFCYYLLTGCTFTAALGEAARVAARKCDHLGARSWLLEAASRKDAKTQR